MEAMLLFMAGAIPFEQLLSDLKEGIDSYDNSMSEEDRENAKNKIFMASLLIVTKEKVEKDGGFMNAVKGFEQSKEAYDIGSRIMGTNEES